MIEGMIRDALAYDAFGVFSVVAIFLWIGAYLPVPMFMVWCVSAGALMAHNGASTDAFGVLAVVSVVILFVLLTLNMVFIGDDFDDMW